MTKYIRIDYTVKPDVDLDGLKAAITEFIAGIGGHHPEHRYSSFQHAADPCRFIHIGEVVEDVLPDLQAKSFFRHFTAYLRERCATGPDVAWLSRGRIHSRSDEKRHENHEIRGGELCC